MKSKLFLVFSLFILFINSGQGQSCGTKHPHITSQKSSDCYIDLNSASLKTVNVIVHVFQKNDGSGSLYDTPDVRNFIGQYIGRVNSTYSNLAPMNLSTSSPYVPDCKIRLKLRSIHFWKNTSLWSNGNGQSSSANNARYNYVMSKPVANKSNSIHIFIANNETSGLGPDPNGVACGIGCGKWAFVANLVYNYNNGRNWWGPGNTLAHEIGHNLDLRHAWTNFDDCYDTPAHSNCWNANNGCSNNTMDYNNHKCALTMCQVSKMHSWLRDHTNYLYSGTEFPNLTGTIGYGSQSNSLYSFNYFFNNEGLIQVTNFAGSTINWTKTGGDGVILYTSNNGHNLYFYNLSSSLTLRANWDGDCGESHSQNIVIYRTNYFFSISPNPTTGFANISVNKNAKIPVNQDSLSTDFRPFKIDRLTVFNRRGKPIIVRRSPGDSFTIDLSKHQSGNYNIIIESYGQKFQYEIIKL